MGIIKPGQHLSRATEFRPGQQPWNKGQSYRLVGWSRKYNSCRDCDSKNYSGRGAHYAEGYCKRCWFSRFKNSERQRELQKIRSRRRWEKIKANPELHQAYKERQKQWRLDSPSFRSSYEKKKKIYRFQKFIRTWFEEQRYVKGHKKLVMLTMEFEGKDYKVPSPIAKSIIRSRDLEIFKREVIRYLRKKSVSYPQVLDNQPLDTDQWHRL